MKQDIAYEFKKSLEGGKKVFGPLIGPGNDPESTVAAIKDIGFDFFMVDNEHSMVGKDVIYRYIGLAREYELPILMRPEANDSHYGPYLDSGIQGLMLPQIDHAEEATGAVTRSYFPPIGRRGWGVGMSPYLLDGMDANAAPLLDLLDYVNRNLLLFPQTESVLAVKSLPRILDLDGITGTIVGTNDLTLDIGDIPAGMSRMEANRRPVVEEKLLAVVESCRKAGKVAGMGGFAPTGYARWAKEGYQWFNLGYIRDNNAEKFRTSLEEAHDLIG